MRRLAPPCLVVAALAALAAGCGNHRQRVAGVPHPVKPSGSQAVVLTNSGVAFRRPRNWSFSQGTAPEVAALSSGQAIVAVWRYPRVETLPTSAAELSKARRALLGAARARDATLRVISARVLRVRGVPGVEVVATETIGLARRKVRSTHLYAHGSEVVVDAYAPASEFAMVDRSAFGPLVRSLRLSAPPVGSGP